MLSDFFFSICIPSSNTIFGGILEWARCSVISDCWSLAFLSGLDLSNHSSTFVQTSQIHPICTEDMHIIFWVRFIEFLLSYCPLMKFLQVTPGRNSATKMFNSLARNCSGVFITLSNIPVTFSDSHSSP